MRDGIVTRSDEHRHPPVAVCCGEGELIGVVVPDHHWVATGEGRARHQLVQGQTLFLFYTRVGDAPERILIATIDISKDWRQWTPSQPAMVLEPAFPWEGSQIPLAPSKHGATGPANALRDPAIFVENNVTYLFYCVKGEQGIALAKLVPGKE